MRQRSGCQTHAIEEVSIFASEVLGKFRRNVVRPADMDFHSAADVRTRAGQKVENCPCGFWSSEKIAKCPRGSQRETDPASDLCYDETIWRAIDEIEAHLPPTVAGGACLVVSGTRHGRMSAL